MALVGFFVSMFLVIWAARLCDFRVLSLQVISRKSKKLKGRRQLTVRTEARILKPSPQTWEPSKSHA